MTEYAILLTGDDRTYSWAPTSTGAATHVRAHVEFAAALAAARPHHHRWRQLTAAKEAKVVRGAAGAVSVTDGPYAETVEQLTGFYLVRRRRPRRPARRLRHPGRRRRRHRGAGLRARVGGDA